MKNFDIVYNLYGTDRTIIDKVQCNDRFEAIKIANKRMNEIKDCTGFSVQFVNCV